MIIRTATSGQTSFSLKRDFMVENCHYLPYYLDRQVLQTTLLRSLPSIEYQARRGDQIIMYIASIYQGKTQRGKKFLQIGCKRFVGVNRQRIIRWAMSYKSK